MSITDTEREALFGCRSNLFVKSVGASLRYYSDFLAFRIGWRWSDEQGRFLEDGEPDEAGTAIVGRDRVQLIITQSLAARPAWVHLDVHMPEQLDQLFLERSDRGARIVEAPAVRPWGMYEMRVTDLDRNTFRVSAPPKAPNQ